MAQAWNNLGAALELNNHFDEAEPALQNAVRLAPDYALAWENLGDVHLRLAERAWARVSRSSAPIGGLLMDQAVFAGVGNIYRAEALFRHRISPFYPLKPERAHQF